MRGHCKVLWGTALYKWSPFYHLQLRLPITFLFLPPQFSTGFISPCRSLCESVADSCAPIMSCLCSPWPHILSCQRFPADHHHVYFCCDKRLSPGREGRGLPGDGRRAGWPPAGQQGVRVAQARQELEGGCAQTEATQMQELAGVRADSRTTAIDIETV